MLWIWFIIVLAACNRVNDSDVATPTMAPTPTRQTTGAMGRPLTPTPLPAPSATPIPSPTPIVSSITVLAQTLAEDGQVIIAQVQTPTKAWVVVQTETAAGLPGEVLGYTAVAAGSRQDVLVKVDPLQATHTLVASLHQDMGRNGTFEFPGADELMVVQGTAVSTTFAVTLAFDLATLTVADQAVAEDGLVHINTVYATVPGWLAVHADESAQPGELLAFTYIPTGLSENVTIAIPWRMAPPDLWVVLYADNGTAQRFEFAAADTAILVNETPLQQPFHVTFPPNVLVYDQAVTNGEVVITRVISQGPGWVTIQYDDNGQPGLIIGFAPLTDGVNEWVRVPVVEPAVTDLLYIMLHQDTGDIGEFDFPREDPQVLYNDRVIDPISFHTNPGNSLFAADQPLLMDSNGLTATVTMPLVITNIDTWVVIQNDQNGQPGAIIGRTWLPAGINHDIPISLDPAQATDTLYATLYHDADSDQTFDVPTGPDAPLVRNRRLIQVTFAVVR